MNIFEYKVIRGKDGKLSVRKNGKFASLSNDKKEYLLERQEYFDELHKRIKINGFDQVDCGRKY